MDMTMARLPRNAWGTVLSVPEDHSLCSRLRDFGFVAGTAVCPRYRSPDGKVTALEFRGTLLALRTTDLQGLQVRI